MHQMINKFKQYCIVGASIVLIVLIVVIFVLGFALSGWEHIKEWLNAFVDDAGKRYLAVGVGAIIALGLTAWRNYALQKQAEATNKQADIAEKRYASEQFSQGVTLLAKDNKDKPAIEARIGGVYALAQLAEADPKQYGAQVMKALVAYIRKNAQLTALPVPSKKDKSKSTTIPEECSEAAHLGEDVKTAFAELKRLHGNEKVRDESKVSAKDLSFSHADFRALRLNEIEWIERPDLSYANLSSANLIESNLQGADLWQAELPDAILYRVKLQGADLRWANLMSARLYRAKLQGADLRWANLQHTNLKEAELQGTDFRRALLQNTNFEGAKAIYTTFENANFDPFTEFGDNVKEWRVWHDDNEFLLKRDVQPLKPDAKWDLYLIFPKKIAPSDVVFILEGILFNFSEKGNNKPGLRAIECRKAVKQWVIDHNSWEHLSDDWRDWLKNLGSNSYAPGDEGYTPDDK